MVDQSTVLYLQNAADRLRIKCIKCTNASNSGHPTSCASIAEIMAVLFLKEMKYKPTDPRNPSSDRFVLSKGHAAPILYAAWAEVGLLKDDDLLNLRKIDSDLEGHPTPRLSFVDVATGSLGQGLSNAAGMAYVGKYIDKASYRVYCIIGDGESAEGSIWEAMAFASYYKLDNLTMLIDVNRLGQSQPTPLEHDLDTYRRRVDAFGWHGIVVDGHNITELLSAFAVARSTKDKPTAIVCKTFKGAGFPNIENEENWHGKPLGSSAADVIKHLEAKIRCGPAGDMDSRGKLHPEAPLADCTPLKLIGNVSLPSPPQYKLGEQVATRLAYGNALARLGAACNRVIGLDGDTKNSTFSIKLRDSRPEQFIECFIAEQNLVGVGIGCAVRQRTIPFVSTFGAFLTRAFDQIRMGAISQTNCNFSGSHCGVSIGEDGPSQMALEDLAMFRSVMGSTVFYPSDAVSTERAVELAANTLGICFIRTGRPNHPVIYNPNETFAIGHGKVVRSSGPRSDRITIVAAGVTLFESLKAAELLANDGIEVRVIDPFTIKPMDSELLRKSVEETCNHLVTVEDHAPEGGIGDAVEQALSQVGVPHTVHRMAVREVPRSGKPEELLHKYGIDKNAIYLLVKKVVGCLPSH
ncbi:Transketolase [Clonorchis sinensis]|uniref:transketolase n=1 Tax=Clonorchis sinensis TaxID=79923 RepID=A0A8T1MM34_CLOSI|nr:Transketolase [Clonorchis sinensis]